MGSDGYLDLWGDHFIKYTNANSYAVRLKLTWYYTFYFNVKIKTMCLLILQRRQRLNTFIETESRTAADKRGNGELDITGFWFCKIKKFERLVLKQCEGSTL